MRKLLYILLIMLFAVTLLAGCNNGGNTDAAPPAAPAANNGAAEPSGNGAAKDTLRVAFVYNAVVGDYGWFYGHEKARQETEASLDFVETIYLESIAPGAQAERVMGDLAQEGYDVVIAASGDFEADVRKVAPSNPDTTFLICCGMYGDTNVESFYPKTYQVWYLLGKLAALLTETNTIGMVGAVTSPMDIQIQNAFLLGAQTVNPEVTERIVYINTYYDPAAERDAALSLIDAGVDVITQGTNTPAHVQAAQEKDVYAMSQYEDMSMFAPDHYVSGEELNWSAYYIPTLQAIYDGVFSPAPLVKTPDYSSGVMAMVKFGPMVTDEMKAYMAEAEQELIANPDIVWQGPIYDNQGNQRIGAGEVLTEEDLTAMTWWVKGTITSGGQ